MNSVFFFLVLRCAVVHVKHMAVQQLTLTTCNNFYFSLGSTYHGGTRCCLSIDPAPALLQTISLYHLSTVVNCQIAFSSARAGQTLEREECAPPQFTGWRVAVHPIFRMRILPAHLLRRSSPQGYFHSYPPSLWQFRQHRGVGI